MSEESLTTFLQEMCIRDSGIDLGGKKDVLGMWVGENDSAKFWATVLNGLKNRGVEDILDVYKRQSPEHAGNRSNNCFKKSYGKPNYKRSAGTAPYV